MSWHFRPLAREDFARLAGWLREPHVARWWADDPAPEALEAQYGGCVDRTEAAEVFIACRDGVDAGLVQRFPLAGYPEYRETLRALLGVPDGAWSIDYLLGDATHLRRGWGTEMLRSFCEALWREQADARCIIVPVHAQNEASWRVLRRAGFVHVASGELEPDNPRDSREHLVWRLDRPG